MSGSISPEGWLLWRPARRYYLWRYRSYSPPRVTILLPEKTLDLNETGSLIWEQLDGARLAGNLAEALQDSFPAVDPGQIERDVLAFLLYCRREKLIYLDWEALR